MSKTKQTEPDGVYFLKLVLYVVLASMWVKFSEPLLLGNFVVTGIPLGFLLGLLFASHDHFQVDRKIEYAILVVVAIMTYFVPSGIVI
jgi:hypothetical protein